jgi:hypothetical protein
MAPPWSAIPLEKVLNKILSVTLKLTNIKVPVVYLKDNNAGSIDAVLRNLEDVILIFEKLIKIFSEDEVAELS